MFALIDKVLTFFENAYIKVDFLKEKGRIFIGKLLY